MNITHSQMIRACRFVAVVALATVALRAVTSEALAGDFAYEGFDYTIDNRVGNDQLGAPGSNLGTSTGFDGPWRKAFGNQPEDGWVRPEVEYSVEGVGTLNSSGHALFAEEFKTPPHGGWTYFNYDRDLDTSVGGNLGAAGHINANGDIGAAGKTLWMSYLITPTQGDSTDTKWWRWSMRLGKDADNAYSLSLVQPKHDLAGDIDPYRFFDGTATTAFGTAADSTGYAATKDQTDLFAVKLEYGLTIEGETKDRATLYINPTLGADETELTASHVVVTDDLSFDRVVLEGGNYRTAENRIGYDEIRFGSSYSNVTPFTPDVAGDGTGDGFVDRADIVALLGDYASTDGGANDHDKSGTVGLGDLAVVQTNYAPAPGSPAAQAVPEPSSILLAILAMLPMACRRRRSR